MKPKKLGFSNQPMSNSSTCIGEQYKDLFRLEKVGLMENNIGLEKQI